MKILDVGCGGNPACFKGTTNQRGSHESDIRRIPADIGVDIRQPDHIFVKKFRLADARNLPFPNKSFDVGFYSHVLEHMDTMKDLGKALMEAKRVCHLVHIWLPSISQSGFTNKDHSLMWIKGIRPFPRLLRRLVWLAYFLIYSRYPRWVFKKLIRNFSVSEERHLILNMDALSLNDLRKIFQGK